ncbi:hypothetical protein [Pendulispora albinea]|uniref:Transmembrane protein n=1 Tax=Pendulispora albinea TaxID=2741071 RepID=A0ABZ2LPX3_9BACT
MLDMWLRRPQELRAVFWTMKHFALWLVSLVVVLAVVWGVFPRVAMAAGVERVAVSPADVTRCHVANADSGFSVLVHQDGPSEFQSSPEDEAPVYDYAQLDAASGVETDGDDPLEEVLAFIPDATPIMRLTCAGALKALPPPLRTSQSFVGLHEKVPR